MAFNLPDGSKIFVGNPATTPVGVTTLSNANPAVAAATAHGLSAGDEFVLASGWEDANDTVWRCASPTTDSFQVEGLDTTDANWFVPGNSGGQLRKIGNWTEIAQVTDIQLSGGDLQFAQVDLLSRRNQIQVPTRFNAASIAITVVDDPALTGYQALKSASRTIATRAFKIVFAGGGAGYFYGNVAFNDMPTLQKGQVSTVKATISLLGKFTRYSN